MFQYAFGRILAERLGFKLLAKPIPGFPSTYRPVQGESYLTDPLVLRGQKPDLSFVHEKGLRREIVLTGYFQRAEYYEPYAEKVRGWFLSDYEVDADVSPDDVVVGVRRGRDYIPQHGIPITYYDEALSLMDFRKVHITSDSPSDPFVRRLAEKYGAIIRPAGALDNLMFIRQFRKIIISNSTFLWWGAFLSDAKEIVFPRPHSGFWSEDDPISKGIALELTRPNCVTLRCNPYKSTIPSEVLRVLKESAVKRVKSFIRPTLLYRRNAISDSPWVFTEDDNNTP